MTDNNELCSIFNHCNSYFLFPFTTSHSLTCNTIKRHGTHRLVPIYSKEVRTCRFTSNYSQHHPKPTPPGCTRHLLQSHSRLLLSQPGGRGAWASGKGDFSVWFT